MRFLKLSLVSAVAASLSFSQTTPQDTKKPTEEKSAVAQEKAPGPSPESTAKATEILKKSMEALGGKALLGIKDIAQSLSLTATTQQGDMQMEMDITLVLPNKMAQKISAPFGEIRMAFDGETGWMTSPMAEGIQDMPEARIRETKNTLGANIYNVFRNLEGPDYVFSYSKVDTIGGKPTHVVKVLHKPSNSSSDYFIDATSMTIVKRATVRETQMGKTEVEELYSDYRDVGGTKMPFKVVSMAMGSQQAEMRFNSIKINTGVKDDVFKKPQ